jgi:DNA topoisomerase-3
VLPDVVKSPKLTADWENELTLVAKGGVSADGFMDKITEMVKGLVQTYNSVSDENKKLFKQATQQETLGKCPNCGGDIVKGKFGAYCQNKCGMNVSRAMGVVLSDSQIKSMLEGKKTLVKGLKGKKGSFDAYLTPEGIEEYSFVKNDNRIKGYQYKVRLDFVKK